MITCVFPGQGSQRAGMGAHVFSRYPEIVRAADDVLGYSIQELCLSDGPRLSQTEFTQPALFVVNALNYLDISRRLRLVPTYLIGHSLGEYNALLAAGVFDFETGLRIVKKRGELMARCHDGAMAALLGDRVELLALVDSHGSDVYLANDNSPDQVVVSGTMESIDRLAREIRTQGLGAVIPLRVSGPFHSPLMETVRDEFATFLEEQTFSPLQIPVLANVSAAPYSSDQVRSNLVNHLVLPVRWLGSVVFLLHQGPMLFLEIGRGQVLALLIQSVIRDLSLRTCEV